MKKRAKNKENKEISFEKKGNLQSLQKKEKISDSILSKIESLNVDIPTNREIFHKTYEKEIWDIMKENNY